MEYFPPQPRLFNGPALPRLKHLFYLGRSFETGMSPKAGRALPLAIPLCLKA